MAVAGFILGILAVFVATLVTLHHYSNIRKQHVIVTISTAIAWFFSFIIVFIIPLDVSSTVYNQCLKDHQAPTNISSNVTNIPTTTVSSEDCVEPWTYLPADVLPIFWKIVYWSSQILTWLVLPIMQSYSNAGEFSTAGKLKSALISNIIIYGTYLALFLIFLIYLVARATIPINAENLKVIGVTASNTWGLFMLVLLFGYGLVDTPRTLWTRADSGKLLQMTYFKISKLTTENSECKEKYEDTLEEVRRSAEVIKYNHSHRKYMDEILTKCPSEWAARLRRNDDYEDYRENENIPSEKQLIKLHINVIHRTRDYTRAQHMLESYITECFQLEDIVSNSASSNHYFKRSLYQYNGYLKLIYSPRLEWWWKIVLRPLIYKSLSVLLIIFSSIVVWSECTFFNKSPVLSIFAQFLTLGRQHYAYISIEVISVLSITYLCICAYRTVFQIRFFHYYISAHHTDENSLLFSGALLCRLTPPLCLNYLSLLQLDSHIIQDTSTVETAYTQIMGHMDVIGFISSGFNIYFPIAILLLCLATLFKLGARCLHCVGFEQFIGEDEMTQELVDEGRHYVSREKRKLLRTQNRQERNEDWNKTLQNSTASMKSLNSLRRYDDESASESLLHDQSDSDIPSTHYGARSSPPPATYNQPTTSRPTTSRPVDEFTSDLEPVDYDATSFKTSFKYEPNSTNNRRNIFDDM